MNVWKEPIQFEWDAGNQDKNWIKHEVTHVECEEVFFDPNKRLLSSTLHGNQETRHLPTANREPAHSYLCSWVETIS